MLPFFWNYFWRTVFNALVILCPLSETNILFKFNFLKDVTESEATAEACRERRGDTNQRTGLWMGSSEITSFE